MPFRRLAQRLATQPDVSPDPPEAPMIEDALPRPAAMERVPAEPLHDPAARDRLGSGLGRLGFEIVDIAALLKLVDDQAQDVQSGLAELRSGASDIDTALTAASDALAEAEAAATGSTAEARASMSRMAAAAADSKRIAEWVGGLSERIAAMEERLGAVEQSTAQVGDIAAEVGILAINARIVAARAGDHGRGFAVVAEAIAELAEQTADVTRGITGDVAAFNTTVTTIGQEAENVVSDANRVLETGRDTDTALGTIERNLETTQAGISRLGEDLAALTRANTAFHPVLQRLATGIDLTGAQVHDGHTRVERLIDLAEAMVQANAAIGGTTDDGPMIEIVTARAAAIAEAFADALAAGDIDEGALFDDTYQPIAGTDPQQVLTRFTALTDRVLPPIQEPVLSLDPRIVFCAAVDRNGYLPTHNRQFSHPQSDDPVWNTAHCRNRRIFDDRVGLKAGRSTAPFLLQVYRRDMGGGESVLMKDLSAPIRVAGRHWGGLRLAYRPS